MKLFLIRHGETVDNVAQVYAGIRDSALTNHGILQANRLGKHLACTGLAFTQIFSSDLQRAFKTAEAIRLAQPSAETCTAVIQLSSLQEQDFGFYEGKPFYARPRGSNKTGKEAHQDQHKKDIGFKDVESKESMAVRANDFLDHYLLPMLRTEIPTDEHVVAVVSHGILLSTLWRCLRERFAARTVAVAPGSQVSSTGVMLDYLGGWSNTGYLELEIRKAERPLAGTSEPSQPVPTSFAASSKPVQEIQRPSSTSINSSDSTTKERSLPERSAPTPTQLDILYGWHMTIKTINGKDHLKGLKRTGGGVGSSQFEEGQKKIESFFKKQKAG